MSKAETRHVSGLMRLLNVEEFNIHAKYLLVSHNYLKRCIYSDQKKQTSPNKEHNSQVMQYIYAGELRADVRLWRMFQTQAAAFTYTFTSIHASTQFYQHHQSWHWSEIFQLFCTHRYSSLIEEEKGHLSLASKGLRFLFFFWKKNVFYETDVSLMGKTFE